MLKQILQASLQYLKVVASQLSTASRTFSAHSAVDTWKNFGWKTNILILLQNLYWIVFLEINIFAVEVCNM